MHHPHAPCAAPPRVLLPRIIHSERRQISCLCTELCLNDLPPCLHMPAHICGISPSGAPCQSVMSCGRLRVSIPVCVSVSDACGARHTAAAIVEAEVCPPRSMDCCDAASLYIQPSLQLLHAEPLCGCSACVKLCVSLELYLLRLEPCAMHPPKPACPPLPLYPPPIQPR